MFTALWRYPTHRQHVLQAPNSDSLRYVGAPRRDAFPHEPLYEARLHIFSKGILNRTVILTDRSKAGAETPCKSNMRAPLRFLHHDVSATPARMHNHINLLQ